MAYGDDARSFYNSIKWKAPDTPDECGNCLQLRIAEFFRACRKESHDPVFSYPFNEKRFKESLDTLQGIYTDEQSEPKLCQKVIEFYIKCFEALDRKFTIVSAVNALTLPFVGQLLDSYAKQGGRMLPAGLACAALALAMIVSNLAAAIHNGRMDYYDLSYRNAPRKTKDRRSYADIIPAFFQLRYENTLRYERTVQRSYHLLLLLVAMFVLKLLPA